MRNDGWKEWNLKKRSFSSRRQMTTGAESSSKQQHLRRAQLYSADTSLSYAFFVWDSGLGTEDQSPFFICKSIQQQRKKSSNTGNLFTTSTFSAMTELLLSATSAKQPFLTRATLNPLSGIRPALAFTTSLSATAQSSPVSKGRRLQ